MSAGCTPTPSPDASGNATEVPREAFGTLPDGTAVHVYTLTNANGVTVRVSDYGGLVLSILAPDRDGTLADITLGYDRLDGYLADNAYFGALVGRYANRIAEGRFTLDGETHQLATNGGPNHLHGGTKGWDKVVWQAQPFVREGASGVTLRHTSPDGDEGYPGRVEAVVTYTLTDEDALELDHRATTTEATPLSLTHHSYFNLTGTAASPGPAATILDHRLTINADAFTPVGPTLIPTGEIRPVAGTPFDFREPHAVGDRIERDNEQLEIASGYDHNFVLNPQREAMDGVLRFAARLADPASGRVVEVRTTEPGLQVYSGNFLGGTVGKGGARYVRRSGIAMETQHFPDSPNQPAFPSATLRPGETYRSRTVYTFRTDGA